jgi:hypothetical protein
MMYCEKRSAVIRERFATPTIRRCASGTRLNGLRSTFGSVAPQPPFPVSPQYGLGSRQPPLNRSWAMKIDRFVGYHEEREALVLSVAGVTAIMLIANLLLLILY